jgi:ABC-2 type transport system ATP-binding protein
MRRIERMVSSSSGPALSVEPVVSVQGLVKSFGHVRALDGLDLMVARCEVHGFLGPNGAGKSTTIRALLGLLRTDAGRASVFGMDPWREAVAIHRRLAYVPGDVALWPNLSGGETVDLLIRMREGDPATSRRAELLERFELDPTKRGRAYSKGNRQKVALVAAFATDAELLILDEPTSGLDPLMEEVFNECVAERTAQGATVLLSSHILSEVERLADRVTIIREGRAVETGTLEDLRHLHRSHVRATVTGTVPVLTGVEGVYDVVVAGQGVSCTVDPAGLPLVLEALTRAGVLTLTSTPPTLEELFLDAYRRPEDVAVVGGAP